MSIATLCALAIMFIVGFYWGRVIKLVLKARRVEGHSAHFLPPELIGKLIRIIWYPTVGVWILTGLLVATLDPAPAPLVPLYNIPAVQIPAVAVAFVILLLTMRCWRKMGRDWRMGIDPNEKNNLIVSGPYAYVRHPIYALQQALAVMSAIAVPVPTMIAVAIIEVVLLTWEAVREERHLTRVHGQTYANYTKRTGRFIPRFYRAQAA
jgi:protein-S-isoprenylcysteine O-methyltransferase Ste14